jgi:hypothetical protein
MQDAEKTDAVDEAFRRLWEQRSEVVPDWIHIGDEELTLWFWRAATLAERERAVTEFVQRVNARAEAEMLKTHRIEGAHHRAIEAELAALKGEPE